MKNKELKIGDNIIYVDNIEQFGECHDASKLLQHPLEWSAEQLEKAMEPAVSIFNVLKKSVNSIAPDEIELAMQFSLSVNGETPVLKIVSAASAAQLSVKFVWKNQE